MPARHSKNRKKQSLNTKFRWEYIYYLVGAIVLLTGFLFFRTLDTKYWDGVTKLHLVYLDGNEDIWFSVFDPKSKEITNIHIPGDTQVEVARQLGVWKLKNVWKLGEQEKVDGKLLAETVTRDFYFPVYVWADTEAEKLTEMNFLTAVKFIFTPMKTNLTVGDKIKLSLFASNVPQSNKREINIADLGYVKKTTLIDGSEGYIVNGKVPSELIALLAYPVISSRSSAFVIVNKSGNNGIPGKIGETISLMGAKVASIEKAEEEDMDCSVVGKDVNTVAITAAVFSCTIGKENSETNLDVKLVIGRKFAQRY